MKKPLAWFAAALLFVFSFTASAAPLPNTQVRLDEALVSAVLGGSLTQVRHLLAQGADVDVEYGDEGTPLMLISCAGGDEELDASNVTVAAELLRHHADVNATARDGDTALMNAAGTCYIQMTALLLAHHAKVNVRDKDGRTALIEATSTARYYGSNLQIVQQLLRRGANVNVRARDGETPLSAVLFDNLNLARLLLNHGADPNIRGWHGKTLLMEAMEYNPPTSISGPPEVLGEEITMTTRKAFGTDKTMGGSGLGYRQRIDLLLAHRADVNAADTDGWTPLMRAAFWSNLSLAKALWAHKASRNARDKTGHTALDYATAAQHAALVSLLKSH